MSAILGLSAYGLGASFTSDAARYVLAEGGVWGAVRRSVDTDVLAPSAQLSAPGPLSLVR